MVFHRGDNAIVSGGFGDASFRFADDTLRTIRQVVVSKETVCSGEGKIGKTDGPRNGSGSPNRVQKSLSQAVRLIEAVI